MRETTIPAARDDLKLERASGSQNYQIIDHRGSQRVNLDVLSAAILAELERPLTVSKLLSGLRRRLGPKVHNEHVYRRLRWLNHQALLSGPRSDHYLECVQVAQNRPKTTDNTYDLPFEFISELQHECQACGGCCSGTDVGPLMPHVVEQIRAHDFGDLDAAQAGIPLFREVDGDDSKLIFTSNFKDACAFLQPNRLCAIHSRLGAAQKPSICQQFPYVFTKTPTNTVAVSFQTECRAWLRAKALGVPPTLQQSMLRQLVQVGAIVRSVMEPICLRPGVFTTWEHYTELEPKLLESIGHTLVLEHIDASKDAFEHVVGALEQNYLEKERYLGEDVWVPFGVDTRKLSTPRPDDSGSIRHRFLNDLTEEMDSTAQEFLEADRALESMRFVLFKRAVTASLVEPDLSYRRVPAPALDEVLRDIWRAGIFAKDPLRYGSLAVGLAVLRLQMRATAALTLLQTRDGSRLDVDPRDAVDSMVLVTKMLRQRSVSAFIRQRSDAVVVLF